VGVAVVVGGDLALRQVGDLADLHGHEDRVRDVLHHHGSLQSLVDGRAGAGGVKDGENMSIAVPKNSRVTFSYVLSTHLVTAIVSPA
jgi:hypothetical protein